MTEKQLEAEDLPGHHWVLEQQGKIIIVETARKTN